MNHGISVIVLAYKEEENLRKILPRIREGLDKTGEKYEIIVVDTEIPLDNTEEVCKDNGARYINQTAAGFGGAFKTGIDSVSMDRVITIDADGAHDPAYIPQMVELFSTRKCDIVIGSRYVKGGGTNDPAFNVAMSKVLNGTYRLFFGLKAKDLSTNFRMYYSEDIKDLDISSRNYDVLQEVLIKIKWNKKGKLCIKEFPIILQKRISGESKRRLFEFIGSYLHTLFAMKKLDVQQKRG